MLGSIALGVAIVAIIVIVVYLATHQHKVPATPAGTDLANTIANAASESWEALKRDLPEIVSAELAQVKIDLAAALDRARAAEANLAATIEAHNADKAAVAARVAAAVAASPELAPDAPTVPEGAA